MIKKTKPKNLMNNIKKEPVVVPELKMKVYHENIYDGKELMTIVGIRETEVELQGDFSGGTHNVIQHSWFPIYGLFRLRKICPEHQKPEGCQLPNVHCGYPNCEPYIE